MLSLLKLQLLDHMRCSVSMIPSISSQESTDEAEELAFDNDEIRQKKLRLAMNIRFNLAFEKFADEEEKYFCTCDESINFTCYRCLIYCDCGRGHFNHGLCALCDGLEPEEELEEEENSSEE